jgi:5-methylcytosine-specific restriction endonuclease McrA
VSKGKDAKRRKLYERNPNCGVCGVFIPEWQFMNTLLITIDHKTPKKLGGSNQLHNLQLTHKKCNSIKGDLLPDDPSIKQHPKYGRRLSVPNYIKEPNP